VVGLTVTSPRTGRVLVRWNRFDYVDSTATSSAGIGSADIDSAGRVGWLAVRVMTAATAAGNLETPQRARASTTAKADGSPE
jgi:hypothetical protein